MEIWMLFPTLFVIGTSLPIELTSKKQDAKFTEGVRQSVWPFPDSPPFESGNVIPYDTMFSSWPSGAPDFHMLADLPPPMNIPHIQVKCNNTHLILHVDKRFNGVMLSREELLLGEGCYSNGDEENQLVFMYHPNECGTNRVMSNGLEFFSNLLHFQPRDFRLFTWWLIPFTVPVTCLSERSEASEPSLPNVSTSPSKRDWGFALKAMHSSWAHPEESNNYYRGQVIHLQATARPGPDQHLFIQSCFVSTSSDPMARPRHSIVHKGCVSLVPEHAAVQFVALGRKDAVNFILNTSHLNPEVYYLHCGVMVSNHGVAPDSKSCNYNKQKQRWEELSGDTDVCSCCNSKCKGSSKRNCHIVSKAVVSTGPLIVTDRRPSERFEVSVNELDFSPPVASQTQMDSSNQSASGYRSYFESGSAGPAVVTGWVLSDAPPGSFVEGNNIPEPLWSPPGLVVAGASFAGKLLEGNAVPGRFWSPLPEVMFISQNQGDTVTFLLPGQLHVGADVSLGASHSPHASMQSDAPAETIQSSPIVNNVLKENMTPLASEQKESLPAHSLTGQELESLMIQMLKSAESDNSMKGMDVIPEGTLPLDLEKASLMEESQRKQWGGRSNGPRMRVLPSNTIVEAYKPQQIDYMLNALKLHDLSDYKVGRGEGVAESVKSKVQAGSTGSGSNSVFRSKLQLSQSPDGSQTLSYEEEVRPGPREKDVQKSGMEDKVQDKRLGSSQKNLLFSFLDMLRSLDKVE